MKKTDRKGSTDKRVLIAPATMGAAVTVEGFGEGVICDWPTFTLSTVKLASGEIIKAAHEIVNAK